MGCRRRRAWCVLTLVATTGCLRTDTGGCGGPASGEPCECPEDAGIGVLAQGRPAHLDQEADRGGTVVVHAEVEPAHLLPLLRRSQ